MVTVAVAGASGYAGGELLRLLSGHPDIEVGAVTGHSSAGSRLGEHQGHLLPLADHEILPTSAENLAGHDVVYLALPHGASGPIAAELGDAAVVIDLAADHRLADAAAWTEFYGSDHAGSWPYGLPELVLSDGAKQREALVGARRVAVPGCYPTSVSLALAPGLAEGVISGGDVVVVAASGTTGAGKSVKPHLLGSEVMGSMSPYGVGGLHRHTPEMEQNLSAAAGSDVRVSFTPTLAPMARGILATATARAADGVGPDDLRAAWEKAYADEPFVHLLPEGTWPRTADTLGANTLHLQVALDRRTGRAIVVAAVDNLTKGTAGAAVQCTNLALGLPETAGLTTIGLAP
ncbi:MAG TPA: N-acetyl-gamma-glutamyl-phosphate reductase [Actinomycetales bacterium]|nr:N-acetyl-gamma-glutamyl-phosphate reductase [Actinomycetales bacterium]